MGLEEFQSELVNRIRTRIEMLETFLMVPDLKNLSISELKFFTELLEFIDTKESLEVANDIYKIINKAKGSHYDIWD